MAVVVMLHGGGGTGKGAATETGWSAKADAAGFLAVYPDALPEDATKPASFSRNPQLWNDGSERFHPGQAPVDDVSFLGALLDQIEANFAVDTQRIYFTGFSNGASMAFRAGAELASRIAAIAPVAGACWPASVTLARPVPMLYLTGTADPLNRIEGGVPTLANGVSDPFRAKPKPPVRDSVLKWVGAIGAPRTAHRVTEDNGVRVEVYGPGERGAEVVYVSVEGLGHTWAGGKSLLPESWVGPQSDAIRATDLIWDFFQDSSLSGSGRGQLVIRRALRAGPGSAPNISRPAEPKLGPGDYLRIVAVGPATRRYELHVPKSNDPERPMAVVLVFHGGGGNPESMIRLSGLNAKADEVGFIAAYPYGSGIFQDRLLTFNGGGCCGYAVEKAVDDVGFARALLDDLAQVANVDAQRVFATGLSNGGIMAYYLASELSDRIAAIAPVGGPMMTETCHPLRPVSVMHFHGTADEFAPFQGGYGKGFLGRTGATRFNSVDHSIRNWVKANGCRADPEVVALPQKSGDGMSVIRKTWGGGRDGTEVVLIEITGGGHTWPGMTPPLATLGKSTQDISANDLMWEFFQKHPLKPAVNRKSEAKP